MMKKLLSRLLILGTLIVVSCEHIPTKPIVEYDSDNSMIQIIQTDTTAHDTAYVDINDIYHELIPIKDTITLSVENKLKKLNQIEIAYKFATNNNLLNVSVRTTRTNDTIFQYKYNPFDINPIKVAEVVSGQCIGLYDVNYKRDYHEKIRQWFFNNDLSPDSTIIEKTNALLRQFNYSGRNEYSPLNGSIPTIKSLSGLKFRFKAQLEGDYFYLCANSCKSETTIKAFVESKITKGLTDANHSVNDVFTCSNSGEFGPNVLFLIGIDKNWKYDALPVGIVVIDDIAPRLYPRGLRKKSIINGINSDIIHKSFGNPWPNKVVLPIQNILINIPTLSASISSSVTISYGNFEGNDYFGYNIPFYVYADGDVQSISIGSHKIDRKVIKNGECMRLHIKSLHIGDNSLPVSATDSRGNKSTSTLSIPIVSLRNNNSYYEDNYDYDELEDRVNDLEDRLNNLEY